MAQAEGKVLNFVDESHIDVQVLETFPYSGRRQLVEYKTTEFSAVCPFSGLPDVGTLLLEYIPQDKIVELKSLKYYLVSYRNVGIYQEHVTNRLFDDIWALLTPQYLKITTIYNTRGGIDTTSTIEEGQR